MNFSYSLWIFFCLFVNEQNKPNQRFLPDPTSQRVDSLLWHGHPHIKCYGVPGSETALEELRWPSPRMLGYKASWRPVLWRRDSWRTSTTIICPRSTTVSGWIWTQGRLSTSTNKVSVLSRCKLPNLALGLRSFIPRQNLKIPKKLNLPPSNERWPFIDHYWWFCEQAWNRNNAILDAWR